jgi:hypothetical protein
VTKKISVALSLTYFASSRLAAYSRIYLNRRSGCCSLERRTVDVMTCPFQFAMGHIAKPGQNPSTYRLLDLMEMVASWDLPIEGFWIHYF